MKTSTTFSLVLFGLLSVCYGQLISYSSCQEESFLLKGIKLIPEVPRIGEEFSIDITGEFSKRKMNSYTLHNFVRSSNYAFIIRFVKILTIHKESDVDSKEGFVIVDIKNSNGEFVFSKTHPLCNTRNTGDGCVLDTETLTGWVPALLPVKYQRNLQTGQVNGTEPVLSPDGKFHGSIRAYLRTPQSSVKHRAACITFSFQIGSGSCSGCPSCGVTMNSFNGVNAYSNGYDQCTGDSCAGQGYWGLQYQCVEYVQRYYETYFPVAYASQMCYDYPSGFYQVSNPQAGDVYVSGSGTYGHTAIVTSNNGNGYVNVIEQNASCGGANTYSISGAECFLRY